MAMVRVGRYTCFAIKHREKVTFQTKEHNSPGSEKSQQFRNNFLQQHICFQKTLGSNMGARQTCFLPRSPPNLVTSLFQTSYRDIMNSAQVKMTTLCRPLIHQKGQ